MLEMSSVEAENLEADAFRRLYPEQYFAKFVEDGIRPDGRLLSQGRAVTIGLRAVSTADGSALVKFGNSTALAGVQYEISQVDESLLEQGRVSLTIEFASFSSAEPRSHKIQERISVLTNRIHNLLTSNNVTDLKQLAIPGGKSCWNACLDIYILDSDGAVFDVALLAAFSALASAKIPAVTTTKDGLIEKVKGATGNLQSLKLDHLPLSVTCNLFNNHLIVDPTFEEEKVSSSSITVILNESNSVYGLYKSGGRDHANTISFTKAMEAAKSRYKEIAEIFWHEISNC